MRLRTLAHTVLLCFALSALATTVIPLSIERLTDESTNVSLARAVASNSRWDASRTRIYTYTRFQVVRQMKGALPATFTVKALGGHADGYTMKVAGVRSWQPGEDAVLFLHGSPDADGTYVVTALMQGDFRLQRQPSGEVFVSNGVREAKQLSTDGSVQEFQGARLTLKELESRVKKESGQ